MIDELKTDYKDDILATGQQGRRTFNIIDKNGNVLYEGVHIEDASEYLQVGDEYGGEIINEQNEAINELSKGTGYVFDTYAEYQQAFAQGEIPVGSIVYIKEGSTDNTITALQVLYNNSTVKSALDKLNNDLADAKFAIKYMQANTLGTPIDISSATTTGNAYQTHADGYVVINRSYRSPGSTSLRVNGLPMLTVNSDSTNSGLNSIYVRTGDKVNWEGTAPTTINFYPYVLTE